VWIAFVLISLPTIYFASAIARDSHTNEAEYHEENIELMSASGEVR